MTGSTASGMKHAKSLDEYTELSYCIDIVGHRVRYGGEPVSTGVWKFKLHAEALQPRKNAEKNTNADSNYEYALAA